MTKTTTNKQKKNNDKEKKKRMYKLIEMDGLVDLFFFFVYDDCPAANLKRLFFCR
jgi:hypothetical protein